MADRRSRALIAGYGAALLLFGFALWVPGRPGIAQELGENELQATLNTYFDNYNVRIVYPAVSLTRRISDSTAINVRYLVDVISAASMRSHFEVDGVSSATPKEDGGGDSTPDEVRHEFGVGVSDLLAGGLLRGGALSLNALYSVEHDYRSVTLAGLFTYLMAKKNTTLQIGYVRSWDRVYPQIRDWVRAKNVYTWSLGVTQLLSPRLIAQLNLSYNRSTGQHADVYQVVQIIENDEVVNYEPVHPPLRQRRAAGLRANYKIGRVDALNGGLRYYWDDWGIRSLTVSLVYRRYLNPAMILGLGLRHYWQTRAFFFKPAYTAPEPYMSVDPKLDSGHSTDYELTLTVKGGHWPGLLLRSPNTELNFRFNFYHRHTASPDWHSRRTELFAYLFSTGIRYHFQ